MLRLAGSKLANGIITILAKKLPLGVLLNHLYFAYVSLRHLKCLPLSCSLASQHPCEQCDVLWNVMIIKISADYIMAVNRRIEIAPRQHCEDILLALPGKSTAYWWSF